METPRSIGNDNLVWADELRVPKLEMHLLSIDRLAEFNGKPAAAPALRSHPVGPTRLDQVQGCADLSCLFGSFEIVCAGPQGSARVTASMKAAAAQASFFNQKLLQTTFTSGYPRSFA